jgi:hypothetical protein
MTTGVRRAIYGALIPMAVAVAAGCGGDDTTSATPALPADVQALRNSMDAFTSLSLAKTAGYSVAITDCMSNGDVGAMGVHFGNTSLFDGNIDPLHPEVLIYEPGVGGDMSLVGVEFVVPYTAVPKTGTPPELFGQKFSQNDVFQLWGLHVWTHRSNPSGLFAPWNPRVHC